MDNEIRQSQESNNNPVATRIQSQHIKIIRNNKISQRSKDLELGEREHLLKSINMGELIQNHKKRFMDGLNNKIHKQWNETHTSSPEDMKNLHEARISHQNNQYMLNEDMNEYRNATISGFKKSSAKKHSADFYSQDSQSADRRIFQLDMDTPKEH
jgi:hypothetical protein